MDVAWQEMLGLQQTECPYMDPWSIFIRSVAFPEGVRSTPFSNFCSVAFPEGIRSTDTDTIFKLISTCAFPGRRKNTFTCDMSLQDNKICRLVFCWTNNSEIFHNKNRAFRYSYQKTRNQPIKTILRNWKIILQTRKVTEKKLLKC